MELSFVYGVELRALGGAVNEKTADFNAWPFREAEIMIAYFFNKEYTDQAIQLFQPIQEFGQGVYGAYSSDTSQEENARVWPGATGKKIKEVKEKYDPTNLFDQNRQL